MFIYFIVQQMVQWVINKYGNTFGAVASDIHGFARALSVRETDAWFYLNVITRE